MTSDVEESGLYAVLSEFGPLEQLKCKLNPVTLKKNGNGFATFQNTEDASAAAAKEIHTVGRILIRVARYQERQ